MPSSVAIHSPVTATCSGATDETDTLGGGGAAAAAAAALSVRQPAPPASTVAARRQVASFVVM